MRIVSGEWRGRPLVAPKGMETRPTADRMRETLFNMLTSRLGEFDGLRVLDLFAGSGALGLEAVSRGAGFVLFAEQDRQALAAIDANVARLDAGPRCRVHRGSALALGAVQQPFDLVFADPPYGSGAGPVAIDKLDRLGWIANGAWVALETAKDEAPDMRGNFVLNAERIVGKARITLYRRETGPA